MTIGKPGLLKLKEEVILPPSKEEAPVVADNDNNPIAVESRDPILEVVSDDPRIVVSPDSSGGEDHVVHLSADLTIESGDPVMLGVSGSTGTVVTITPTRPNYVSTDTGALQIDQTDPTNIIFTPLGFGGSGSSGTVTGADTLWVSFSSGAAGQISGGSIQRVSNAVTYSSAGLITFIESGVYVMTVVGDLTSVEFNPEAGYPANQVAYQLVADVDGNPIGPVCSPATTQIIATAGDIIQPQIVASQLDLVLTPVIGFSSGGGSTGGNSSVSVVPRYRSIQFTTFNSTGAVFAAQTANPYLGAPHNGVLPSHNFTATTYLGDATSPILYPNAPMSMVFSIQPNPNLGATDLTITQSTWDTWTPPSGLHIYPAVSNEGFGTLIQGFCVILDGHASLAGTGFKLTIAINGLEGTSDLYFRFSIPGETDTYPGNTDTANVEIGNNPASCWYPFVADAAYFTNLIPGTYGIDTTGTPFNTIYIPPVYDGSFPSEFRFAFGRDGQTFWEDPAGLFWNIVNVGTTVSAPDPSIQFLSPTNDPRTDANYYELNLHQGVWKLSWSDNPIHDYTGSVWVCTPSLHTVDFGTPITLVFDTRP